MPLFRFLPAILAAITDVGTTVFVRQHQPDYPIQFVTFQIVMVGAALLMAVPQRKVWLVAFLVLLGGVLLAGMSVGMFYIPTLIAAGWVMARRNVDSASVGHELFRLSSFDGLCDGGSNLIHWNNIRQSSVLFKNDAWSTGLLTHGNVLIRPK